MLPGVLPGTRLQTPRQSIFWRRNSATTTAIEKGKVTYRDADGAFAGVVSAALGCDQFPIIIPAATEAGLTLLSEASFQLSPNVELQGAIMAEYAVRALAADSAAVIAPTSVEYSAMTTAFIDRFTSLGGTVVAVEQYRDRDRDFGTYIRDIKNVVLGRIPDSAVYLDDRGDR